MAEEITIMKPNMEVMKRNHQLLEEFVASEQFREIVERIVEEAK